MTTVLGAKHQQKFMTLIVQKFQAFLSNVHITSQGQRVDVDCNAIWGKAQDKIIDPFIS